MPDAWNPRQYERFRAEREQPFHDLLDLVDPEGVRRAIDLGCGTGRLTAVLHARLGPERTIGVDSSQAMLVESRAHVAPGLEFVQGDLADHCPSDDLDLVFSNAALHWVDDQRAILERVTSWLAPRGQLAVQVPANFDHVSHRVAADLAREEPFASAVGEWERGVPVLAPERYAELLFELGYESQSVFLRVYPHVLESTDAVVEWQRGTLLTAYRERLGEELYTHFVEAYRDSLRAELGDPRPCFYPFKRILLHARRP